MSKKSRDKGAAFEREVAAIFTEAGLPARRRLGQARDSGHDLDGAGPFTVECKRRARIAVYEWFAQAERATEAGGIPLVVMRQDHGEHLALLRLSDLLNFVDRLRRLGALEP